MSLENSPNFHFQEQTKEALLLRDALTENIQWTAALYDAIVDSYYRNWSLKEFMDGKFGDFMSSNFNRFSINRTIYKIVRGINFGDDEFEKKFGQDFVEMFSVTSLESLRETKSLSMGKTIFTKGFNDTSGCKSFLDILEAYMAEAIRDETMAIPDQLMKLIPLCFPIKFGIILVKKGLDVTYIGPEWANRLEEEIVENEDEVVWNIRIIKDSLTNNFGFLENDDADDKLENLIKRHPNFFPSLPQGTKIYKIESVESGELPKIPEVVKLNSDVILSEATFGLTDETAKEIWEGIKIGEEDREKNDKMRLEFFSKLSKKEIR